MQLTTNVVESVLTEPRSRHFACGARHVQRDDATMALRSVPAAAMKQTRVKEQALTGFHRERDRLLMELGVVFDSACGEGSEVNAVLNNVVLDFEFMGARNNREGSVLFVHGVKRDPYA